MNGNAHIPTAENGVLLPFNLLALAVLVLMGAMLSNTLRQRTSLREQLQNADVQGRHAVDTRLHYYNLYKELYDLSIENSEAGDIIQKYNIQFTEPETATNGAPQ